MKTYYIPYALHRPVRDAQGNIAVGKDGYGNEVNGLQHPEYDTLIGVANLSPENVRLRFMFLDQKGTRLKWSDGSTSGQYTLQPHTSIATTLISGNVFGPERGTPCPPQDFVGYGIIEADTLTTFDLPMWAMVGGGGFYPKHWNTFGAEVPIYTAIAIRRTLYFPYVIPYFEDPNHFGDNSYRSGLVLTNFDLVAHNLIVEYRTADFYEGQSCKWTTRLEAGQQVSIDIYGKLLELGYAEHSNSEGYLTVRTESTGGGRITGYVLISNRGYSNFSAGQGHWQPRTS